MHTRHKQELKITDAVMIHNGFRFMSASWDLVRKSVVANAWLHCHILSPYQAKLLREISDRPGFYERALRSHRGTFFAADEKAFDKRSKKAVEQGILYLASSSGDEKDDYGDDLVLDDVVGDVEQGVEWTDKTFNMLSEDIEELCPKDFVVKLATSAVQSNFEEEDRYLPVMKFREAI